MSRVILFGAGGLAMYLAKNKSEKTNIVAFVISEMVTQENIYGVPVIELSQINSYEYDYIVVAFSDVNRGISVLMECGVPEDKIVGYSFVRSIPYKNNSFQIDVDKQISERIKDEHISSLFNINKKKYYLCAMNKEHSRVISNDFVREQTAAMLAEEIKRKQILGDVAELGVYRGEFSKVINNLFYDRKMYMFDTFEGFDSRDVRNDSSLQNGEQLNSFDDTSVEIVLNKMKYPENCIIKKGFFPDSFDIGDIRFAFVSIDVDLYDPVKAGLELFYRLLSEGGYIMVHDYNNIVYQGTTLAVREYCDKRKISYVPIPDLAGSIIITK